MVCRCRGGLGCRQAAGGFSSLFPRALRAPGGAGPQLLLQAFLQRFVNSGGRIEREYGLDRMPTDLLIVWPQSEVVIECKILHKSLEQTIAEGLQQTAAYMERCEAKAGHLVIFDRRAGRRWSDKWRAAGWRLRCGGGEFRGALTYSKVG